MLAVISLWMLVAFTLCCCFEVLALTSDTDDDSPVFTYLSMMQQKWFDRRTLQHRFEGPIYDLYEGRCAKT